MMSFHSLRRRHSRSLRAPLLGLWLWLVLSLITCAHPPPNLSPQGRIAFVADQLVLRIGELQKAAIAAEAGGGLPTAQARLIVQFSGSAARVLKETPAGWQKTLTTSWAELKAQLPLTKDPILAAAMGAVDALLAALLTGV